jgi:hypothetical protein
VGDEAHHYLLRDLDGVYGRHLRNRVRGLGIEEVMTAPQSPWHSLDFRVLQSPDGVFDRDRDTRPPRSIKRCVWPNQTVDGEHADMTKPHGAGLRGAYGGRAGLRQLKFGNWGFWLPDVDDFRTWLASDECRVLAAAI